MKKFKLHWTDGTEEIVEGTSIGNAFSMAGYGSNGVMALDYWEEIKEDEDEKCTEEGV